MEDKKLQEQGLAHLKIKEFTLVNDCFQMGRNAVIGVFYSHFLFVKVIIIFQYCFKERGRFFILVL